MSSEALAPIIIKRKKVVAGGGHHGGAWKVAYADFVTAMMAFFLLMWLLNATTEQQRKGLADYFSPTIPITKMSGGGDGSFWGDDVFSEDTLAQTGTGASKEFQAEMNKARGDLALEAGGAGQGSSGPGALAVAEDLLETLTARGGESMAALKEARHVVTRLSDEGLVIDIFDSPSAQLFDPGTTRPTPLLEDTLASVASLLGLVTNDISVAGYLAARPIVVRDNPVWDLSTSRADTARAMLEGSGFDPRRIQRVTGFADRKPADLNRMSLRNNRIEIVVLRDDL
ncbi:flagellar motor protein MotB [Pseudoruegeria sp. SK021]|uniref:OmpA/MotB family protein n=1 Tax=Pseudoruegeria sp. SK021 TaxID=1933035 RepID=UPI000A24C787|nr:flagellar motor protein MotB [Pseudoruegeria sp. SK021]OSP56487.1 chemotaxis protein MotB [Pseudoruegeria sp. SK021]